MTFTPRLHFSCSTCGRAMKHPHYPQGSRKPICRICYANITPFWKLAGLALLIVGIVILVLKIKGLV